MTGLTRRPLQGTSRDMAPVNAGDWAKLVLDVAHA